MKQFPFIATIMVLAAAPIHARPIYAIKLGKRCEYCHVNPKGGGVRNPRGLYFAEHGHKFDGYDEEKVMGQYKPKLLHKAWSESLPKGVRKIGVGDTVGDGSPRLVMLSEGTPSDSRVLTISKWESGAWKKEFSADAAGSGDRLAVGKYAQGKPAVIVTSKELFYWDGKTYAKKTSSKSLGILGTVSLKTGGDKLLIKDGDSLKAHSVDVNADNWLGAGADPPPVAYASFTDMKGSKEELTSLGMTELLAGGGVVGVWDTQKANLMLLYGIHVYEIRVDKPGAKSATDFVVTGTESSITVVDPRVAAFKPLWQSEKLEGNVLDVTLNDPRSGAKGILVLSDNSEDQKGHTLCFYQLD